MPGFLGQNLLDLGLKARHLRQALRAQAQEALMALRLAPPQSYMMRLSSPLPSPGAGLERGEVMELLLGSQEGLAAGQRVPTGFARRGYLARDR